jgi:hypothetical protein
MICSAPEACGGNRAEAARKLGIHRQLLYTKMRRLGLLAAEASGKTSPCTRKRHLICGSASHFDSSQSGELHAEALTDLHLSLDSSGSCHRAKAAAFR